MLMATKGGDQSYDPRQMRPEWVLHLLLSPMYLVNLWGYDLGSAIFELAGF